MTFAPGASVATIQGTIKGDQTIDYVLRAKAGQVMKVSLETKNGANSFNVLPPGSKDEAIFVGSTQGNEFAGTLSVSGDYRIRVYLMRSAARRGESARYTLAVAVTGAGGDARVPGTGYHATGNVPCSMGGGQPTGSCPFGVRREGAGSAIVTVTKPDGRTRAITFAKGEAVGADVGRADRGEFRSSREGDLTTVRIGSERYEIPDAVIFGG